MNLPEEAGADGMNWTRKPKKEPVNKRYRKYLKIHGVSVDSSGRWWFACSSAKSKTFHYVSHEEMKRDYPQYLVGYYERHLRFEIETKSTTPSAVTQLEVATPQPEAVVPEEEAILSNPPEILPDLIPNV